MIGKEKLHPELKKCLINGGPFGKMIAHPLVHELFYSPQLNYIYNERFKHKKEMRERALKERDFNTFVFMAERPYRFQEMMSIKHIMKTEELWKLASAVWIDSENIHQHLFEWRDLIDAARHCNGAEHFMNEDDKRIFKELPDELTLYRGCRTIERDYGGLSYTTEKKTAVWFANRFRSYDKDNEYYVKQITVPKHDCFAYLNGRQEFEIIVYPTPLAKLKGFK